MGILDPRPAFRRTHPAAAKCCAHNQAVMVADDATDIDRDQNVERKEVNAMNEYTKPDVVVLGDAAALIQGSKPGRGESVNPLAYIKTDECTED